MAVNGLLCFQRSRWCSERMVALLMEVFKSQPALAGLESALLHISCQRGGPGDAS